METGVNERELTTFIYLYYLLQVQLQIRRWKVLLPNHKKTKKTGVKWSNNFSSLFNLIGRKIE